MVKYLNIKNWSWCNEVENVESRQLDIVYRTDAARCTSGSCKSNCAQNPFCLNALGEKKLSVAIQKDSTDTSTIDRSKYLREEDAYAGLVNLGATCYINTYLQVWFNNPFFRDTILHLNFDNSFQLQETAQKESDTSLLSKSQQQKEPIPELKLVPNDDLAANLKMIFLLLKYSHRKSIDPNFFIKALDLDENMQQVTLT